MGTAWIPMTRFDKSEWLLANGDIITEPNLEQTSTGLKVRVSGTSASFFSKDLETLLANAAKQIADDRSTYVVCSLTGTAEAMRTFAVPTPPVFFTGANHRETTRLWWKFSHPKMAAYSMTVMVDLTRSGESYSMKSMIAAPLSLNNRYGNEFTNKVRSYDTWYDLMYAECQTNKIGWEIAPDWAQGDTPLSFGTERSFIGKVSAYKALLKLIQYMENLDFLSWPTVYNHGTGVAEFEDLEQVGTNLPPDFRADLQDHLDNSPDAARLKELYEEMIVILKRSGLVINPDSDGFLRALDSRNPLRIPLGHATDVRDTRDYNHTLAVDVASGTFVVECGHVDRTNMDEVAEHWEQAKTIAALTGEEDILLAYARRYAEKNATTKTKQVMQERGLKVPK